MKEVVKVASPLQPEDLSLFDVFDDEQIKRWK
jgi:hypothetical protein